MVEKAAHGGWEAKTGRGRDGVPTCPSRECPPTFPSGSLVSASQIRPSAFIPSGRPGLLRGTIETWKFSQGCQRALHSPGPQAFLTTRCHAPSQKTWPGAVLVWQGRLQRQLGQPQVRQSPPEGCGLGMFADPMSRFRRGSRIQWDPTHSSPH